MNAGSPKMATETLLHPVEEATIQSFVVPFKKERMRTLLANPKGRWKALESLNHFCWWDPRFIQSVPKFPFSRFAAEILALLQNTGAPAECYVISGSLDTGGASMTLSDGVTVCTEYYFASVLSCVPGELAMFFDEGHDPLLLRRPGGAAWRPPTSKRPS